MRYYYDNTNKKKYSLKRNRASAKFFFINTDSTLCGKDLKFLFKLRQ